MGNKSKVTSARVASEASRVMRSPRATKEEKSAAASALSQRPGKK
jgi:hypothetical protein